MSNNLFSFISGRAGTGKSYQLQKMYKDNPSTTVLTATTGIAAINAGAGITINSLLWYFDSKSLLDAWTSGKLDFRLGKVYNSLGVRRILLDECSMLCATDLSVLCLAIDRLNDKLAENDKHLLGLTLAGDFAQLPPINGDFAFESEHWEKFEPHTEILRHVYRQDDKEFVQALQWVREGEGKKAAAYFADRMERLIDPDFDGTSLYPYNAAVDRQNQYRLERVGGAKISFDAKRVDKQRPEWKNIPGKLELKLGALVMILANKSVLGSLVYCNGDLGEVIGKEESGTALVRLKRTGEPVAVEHIDRFNEDNVKGKKSVVGMINYMPLRLAYATTVHKSQGLTLDNVQVDFRAEFFAKCPGMLYVALSRARSKAGLRLIGGAKTFIQHCKMNPKIRRFL